MSLLNGYPMIGLNTDQKINFNSGRGKIEFSTEKLGFSTRKIDDFNYWLRRRFGTRNYNNQELQAAYDRGRAMVRG